MERTQKVLLLLTICAALFLPAGQSLAKWSGVDETVVEKFAKEAGREARDPYINTDQGDLLLFVFTLAGLIGGFIAGYLFREVFGGRPLRNGRKIHV